VDLTQVRYFLDTQLYSYLANGTIPVHQWRRVLAGRELCLSPLTACELLEGLLHASPHTCPISQAALAEAALLRGSILPSDLVQPEEAAEWLRLAEANLPVARGQCPLPESFLAFRQRADEGRQEFIAGIRGFARRVMPNYRRLGDLLFSAEWQAAAGRSPGEHLDAAFVFRTWLLDRTMRIRYNPEKHPSDYLDYMQLKLLKDERLAFLSADRKLVCAVSRSLESDRIYLWDELLC
jgi:predicted nucleic acid-binding protein